MSVNSFSGQPAIPASYGFAAGKNKIINGDFRINQRSFSSSTSYGYGFDRWLNAVGGGTGTATYTSQTFTPGTAPVAGYEGVNFIRCVTSGQSASGTFTIFQQPIEDVRTLAGQTVTVSFWAKAASSTPKMFVELEQYFGPGGSANVGLGSTITLTTSWARYSVSLNVPNISGKTIGVNSSISLLLWCSAGTDFNARTSSLGIQSNTFDLWGVQVEAGSVATAFQTATGTIQGELAACQRYFQRIGNNSGAYYMYTSATVEGTTTLWGTVPLPVTMRTTPSISATASGNTFTILGYGNVGASTIYLDAAQSGPQSIVMGSNTISGLTLRQSCYIRNLNDTTGTYISLNAEL